MIILYNYPCNASNIADKSKLARSHLVLKDPASVEAQDRRAGDHRIAVIAPLIHVVFNYTTSPGRLPFVP